MNEILQRGALNGIAREQLEHTPEFLRKSQNPDEQTKEGIKVSLEKQQIMEMLNKLEEWYSPKPPSDIGKMPTMPPPDLGEMPTMPPPDLGEMPKVPPPFSPDTEKIPETEIPQTEIDPNNTENFTDYNIPAPIRIQLMKKYLEKGEIGENFESDARAVLRGIGHICDTEELLTERINIDSNQISHVTDGSLDIITLDEEIKGLNAIVNAITKLEKTGIFSLDVIKALTQNEKISDINFTVRSVNQYFRDSIEKKINSER